MDDYVSKPIRVEELVGALSRSRPLEAGQEGTTLEAATGGAGQLSDPEPESETRRSTPLPPSSPDPTPRAAVLDPTALENLLAVVGGEFEYLVELIDSFLEEAPKLLAELDGYVADGDPAGVRRVAHSLKSNGADFGARVFSELCKKLEMMGKDGDLEGAADLVARIAAEYKDVEASLGAVRREGRIGS